MGAHEPVRPAAVNATRFVRSAAAGLAGVAGPRPRRWRSRRVGCVGRRRRVGGCPVRIERRLRGRQRRPGGGTTPPTPAPDTAPPAPATPAAPPSTGPPTIRRRRRADLDGKIVIQIGDGDPIVIDLGDLGALGGRRRQWRSRRPRQASNSASATCRSTSTSTSSRRLGLPGLDVFGDGDAMTVTGPNGLSVLTLRRRRRLGDDHQEGRRDQHLVGR